MGYIIDSCTNCGNRFGLPRIKVGHKICCRECAEKEWNQLIGKMNKIKLKDMSVADLIKTMRKFGVN